MRATLTDLGQGVTQVTIPLPWALDHVHCYAVADPHGWTLIDAGLGTRSTAELWAHALDELGSPPVRRLVITHYHPDHIGGSADLVALTGAREVVQGAHDARMAAEAWGVDESIPGYAAFLEAQGMPAELARASAEADVHLPVRAAQPTRLVDEGDTVEIAGEEYAVHVLGGHSDGHIVLQGARSGRLFGGDVLLDEISPNVGHWPDTAPDPLARYLQSLDAVDRMAPSLVLPGHGPAIADAPRRTAELRAHHAERLDAHVAALNSGAATPFEVAQSVWNADDAGFELAFHEQRFALVEALAHLERLEAEGRAHSSGGRWAAGQESKPSPSRSSARR